MINLEQYKLTDWEWYENYKKKYGAKYLFEYKEKIERLFALLKPGKYYDLSTAGKNGSNIFFIRYEENSVVKEDFNPDLFVKICCMLMLSDRSYLFSDDYQKIKRI